MNLNQSVFVENAIKENLNILQIYLNQNHIKNIELILKQLNQIVLNFDEYELIVKYKNIFIIMIDGLIADQTQYDEKLAENVEQKEKHEQKGEFEKHEEEDGFVIIDKINELCSALFDLKGFAMYVCYTTLLHFMHYVLNHSNREEILFNNISLNKEDINRRYRRLALSFHSDKTEVKNISTDFQNDYTKYGDQVFKCATDIRNRLLASVENSPHIENISFDEEKAHELWRLAIDFRNAHKQKWDKLIVLKKEELKYFTSDELMNKCLIHAKEAYIKYRDVCKLADKEKVLQKQIKLRGYLALTLYISGQYLDAQLFALSAINLILRHFNDVSQQQLLEAKNIFEKVKNGYNSEVKNDSKTNNDSKDSKTDSEISDALVITEFFVKEYSYLEKMSIMRTINSDLEKIGIEIMNKADNRLVCDNINENNVLNTRLDVRQHFLFSRINLLLGLWINLISGKVLIAVTSIGVPVLGMFAGIGIGIPILGICFSHFLLMRSEIYLTQPIVREKLNEILNKTLFAYYRKDFQQFLEVLSVPYNFDVSLLELKCGKKTVDCDRIISVLLFREFRPDGIAFLLNMIGEVLMSGKVKVEGMTSHELKLQGFNVMKGVMSEILENKAKSFDSYYNKRIEEIKSDFPKTLETPHFSRLEEIRNTAKINLAIHDILNGGEEDILKAKKLILKIEISIKCNQQYIGLVENRLEILKDFLWIISCEETEELKFPEIESS